MIRPRESTRPPVPVEPLAPVPEDGVLNQPISGSRTNLINPVPHVELQPTARFAPGANRDRASVPQRSLTHSGTSFNIRLHPANDSPRFQQNEDED